MNNEEKIEKLRKFTNDPDWALLRDMMLDYLSPLRDISSIDTRRSNDEIASEVRGRQISIERLTRFLNGAKIITGTITKSNPTTFK